MTNSLTLATAKERQHLTVKAIAGDEITMQALRFGLEEGSRIYMEKNIAGGPVIILRNQMEIAIGRSIAEKIEVTLDKDYDHGHH